MTNVPGSIVWIDATAGASGDMLLGALVDAGVPLGVMQAAIDPLDLGIGFRSEPVRRSGLGATKVHVDVPNPQRVRHLPDILELLNRLDDYDVRSGAGAVFERLAEAEAAVHRVPVDEVHFHEVGALDCIADIVGVIAGFTHLDAEHVVCSAIALGSGHANTEHGRIPVPVPAVLELVRGAPTMAGPALFESTTPTGAALLMHLSDEWGSMPPMALAATGSGAGTNDAEGHANIVRIVRGHGAAGGSPRVEAAVQIDANVDDMDPRLWPTVIHALLDAGAQDAWITPITMKKGRPAFTVSALCSADRVSAVRTTLFTQTSTIGVREHPVSKHVLDRWHETVEVEGQPISVKLAALDAHVINRSVEWNDVVAAAAALELPAKTVLQLATEQAARLAASSDAAEDHDGI